MCVCTYVCMQYDESNTSIVAEVERKVELRVVVEGKDLYGSR